MTPELIGFFVAWGLLGAVVLLAGWAMDNDPRR